MANTILAAPCVARNKSVLEITRIFEQILKYLIDDKANCEFKSNCLQSFETLIDLGFKAVKQNNIKSDIDTYQQYFRSYIYHSSVYMDNRMQSRRVTSRDCAFLLAQSLANMLVLAENNFAKLGYPSYYQDFAKAIEVLFEYVGGGSEVCEFDAGRC